MFLNIDFSRAQPIILKVSSNTKISNEEIVKECSEFSADGFKCANACFDTPQDFIPEGAKDAKCPQIGQICCKRTKSPNVRTMPEGVLRCEDAQSGYKCLDFDMCDPDNSFFSKKATDIVKNCYITWMIDKNLDIR